MSVPGKYLLYHGESAAAYLRAPFKKLVVVPGVELSMRLRHMRTVRDIPFSSPIAYMTGDPLSVAEYLYHRRGAPYRYFSSDTLIGHTVVFPALCLNMIICRNDGILVMGYLITEFRQRTQIPALLNGEQEAA